MALGGPNDEIVVPKIAQIKDQFSTTTTTPNTNTNTDKNITELDYEVELVIVIGNKPPTKNIPIEHALDYVLGYTVGNDISHRTWQQNRGGGQWSLGKMYDGWAPIGPAIVSKDLIPNPQSLTVSTWVNGQKVQQESTSDMIFSVAYAISFLSQGATLMPGDIIFTGTPSGVGAGRKPVPLWLKHGDSVTVNLSQVGSITNKIVYQQIDDDTNNNDNNGNDKFGLPKL